MVRAKNMRKHKIRDSSRGRLRWRRARVVTSRSVFRRFDIDRCFVEELTRGKASNHPARIRARRNDPWFIDYSVFPEV
jgi:hypothetical protein